MEPEANTADSCQDDPSSELLRLNSIVNKHVKVEMIQNYTYLGFVHAIDPETKSMILSVPNENSFQTTLLPGHAITNITETPETTLARPTRKPATTIPDEQIQIRKESILNWLHKHLLPAEEEDGVIVIGTVSILHPYSSKDICASNPVIADQIRKILDSLPV